MRTSTPASRLLQLSWAFAVVLFDTTATADCLDEWPSLQESNDRASIVVRLRRRTVIPNENVLPDLLDLPCSIEIYEGERGYDLEDTGFWGYEILDVFKQDWSKYLPGDNAIVMLDALDSRAGNIT